MAPRTFELRQEHITLLRRAVVYWEDCETGAPAIDCKRPYGNSYVAGDVAEILGWPIDPEDGLTAEQRDRALNLHAETEHALRCILHTLDVLPGIFYNADKHAPYGTTMARQTTGESVQVVP